MIRLRSATTAALTTADRDALGRLFAAAWPDEGFTTDDWDHAMGGRHWLIEDDGRIVSHASAVARTLWVGEQPLRTGYLEAVATHPAWQRRGLATRAVRDAGAFLRDGFELGALSTGSPAFYERLGWLRWQGPTFVRTDSSLVRTEDEDDGILVLLTPRSPHLDVTMPIACEPRSGDVW